MVHLEEVHNFFWGLTLENEKRYSQTVETGFHISMAAMEPHDKKGSSAVCVMIQAADGEFLLCTLNTETTPQQQLDLNFMENEQITFFLSGKARVHLTGYLVPPEEEEEAEEEESGEEEENDSEEFETDPGSGSEDEDVPQLQALEDSDSDSEEEATAGGKRKKKQHDKQVKKKLLLEEAEDAHSDDDEEEDDDDDENDIMDINELLASVDDDSDDEDDDYDEDGDELEAIEEEGSDVDSDVDSSGEDTEGSFLAKPQKKSKQTESASKKKKDKKKVKENAVETPKSENKKKKHKKGKAKSVDESPAPLTSASEPDTPATDKKKRKKKKKNKNKNQENDIDADTPKQDGKNSTEGKKMPEGKKTPGGSAANSPKPKKITLQGGIIAEDVKEGHGPQAIPGKMTAVHYVGTLLQNNKEFDRTHGTPFKFKLGKGEVIKGWDIGVKGMKVGGKRKLTIPAKMGYGSSRTGSIPANSTLVFEVELKSVS